jgi:hypothetical protein
MTLSTSVSIVQGPTSFSITGGSATSFVNDGTGTNGTKSLVDSTNTNPLTRKRARTRVVMGLPAPNANALAKLSRAQLAVQSPYVEAVTGKLYPLPDTVELTFHPSMTLAEKQAKRNNLVCWLMDAELDNMLTNGIND